MSEEKQEIDLTITLGKSCGSCLYYRNSMKYIQRDPELVRRFKGVPENSTGLGGYCMKSDKIRLTSRIGTCGAWEKTKLPIRLAAFKRMICNHEWVYGCDAKKIIYKQNNSLDFRIKNNFLKLESNLYCKNCNYEGPYEWDSKKNGTFIIPQTLDALEYLKNNSEIKYLHYVPEFEITTDNINPDFLELEQIFGKIPLRKPFPKWVEIKDSWIFISII